jgi:hypothetical protein
MRLLVIAVLFVAIPTLAPAAPVPAAGSELHVVALHEGNTKTGDMLHGGKASVKVDRPGKDVILVVNSYHSITWDITATPATKLKKVFLGGYEKQAANAPAGTEVLNFFSEGRRGLETVQFAYDIDRAGFRNSVQDLFRFTEQEISSFQGVYRFDPKSPLVVDAVQKDERLLSSFPSVEPAEKLPKLKFQAVRAVPDRFGAAYSFGDFTTAGPDNDSLVPLPKGIRQVAFDAAAKMHYGMDNHSLYEVDLVNAKATKLDVGMNVPRMSWMGGLTFDTKRGQLVVGTFGGGGVLYSYAPKTTTWAAPAELKGAVSAGLAYHAADDTLYSLKSDRGESGKNVLSKINAKGAVIGTVELGGPMFPGVIGRGPDAGTQIISTGEHIVILIQNGTERFGGEGRIKAESFLYLFDPKTDKVKLAWKESR